MTPKLNNPRAFTLTEVMLSVALVLILLLGVNSVFKMTSDTVGAGQALSTINRDHRAVQATLYRDVQNAVKAESPAFIITSQRIAAFRNQQDYLTDRDFDITDSFVNRDVQIRTTDLNENNNEGEAGEPGEVIHTTNYGPRNHRADILSFFVRDLLPRQTGNDGTFAANMSSYEGWVWYGHLAVFDDDTTNPNAKDLLASYPAPGAVPAALDPNPNNWHAAQWIVGRQAILLKDRTDTDGDTDEEILDNDGIEQVYINRVWDTPTDTNTLLPLSPLQFDAEASAGGILAQTGRYDLGATSMDLFRQRLAYTIAATPTPPGYLWWNEMFILTNERFWVKPIPDIPISADGMARSSPIFLRGCTQFMVEFAGDYVAQDATTGAVVAGPPDGFVDYIIRDDGNGPRRQVRWYGLPRDMDGDGDIVLDATAPITSTDVVPLRDVLALIGLPAAVFERDVATKLPAMPNYAAAGGGMAWNGSYVCAWGPADTALLPRMLRIVVSLDDQRGRINEAQTFEYVIELP